MAEANNPFASAGNAGYITFNPGVLVNQASLVWEWNGPAPTPAPQGILTTTSAGWLQR